MPGRSWPMVSGGAPTEEPKPTPEAQPAPEAKPAPQAEAQPRSQKTPASDAELPASAEAQLEALCRRIEARTPKSEKKTGPKKTGK